MRLISSHVMCQPKVQVDRQVGAHERSCMTPLLDSSCLVMSVSSCSFPALAVPCRMLQNMTQESQHADSYTGIYHHAGTLAPAAAIWSCCCSFYCASVMHGTLQISPVIMHWQAAQPCIH